MAKEREYFFEYKMGYMLVVSSIVTAFAIVVPLLLMYFWFDDTGFFDFATGKTSTLIIGFVIMFLWMVLHELLHGAFYILGGAKRKNITYGAALEKGIFYCRCGEYVNKNTIMKSLLAPFTIIGVITLIIGMLAKQWWLVALSGMNIGGAGADLCMFFFFLKRKDDIKFMEYGDSSIFSLKTAENLEYKKFKCVKLIDKEKVPKNDNKVRLVISKASWWFAGLMAILFVLIFVLEKIS